MCLSHGTTMLPEAQRNGHNCGAVLQLLQISNAQAQDRSVGNADGNCRLTVGIAGSDNPSPSTVPMSVDHIRNYGRLDRSARRVSYGLSFQSTHLSSTRGFISEPIAQENACSRACMAVRVRARSRPRVCRACANSGMSVSGAFTRKRLGGCRPSRSWSSASFSDPTTMHPAPTVAPLCPCARARGSRVLCTLHRKARAAVAAATTSSLPKRKPLTSEPPQSGRISAASRRGAQMCHWLYE